MSKSIKIIFHIGRPKTGTTFLQKNAEKVDEIFYFGKLARNNVKERFNNEIAKVHNSLFSMYRAEAENSFSNPSRNSFKLIDEYTDIICKKIIENPNKNIFILSDECIGDYSNFCGEWNTFLIASIGDIVEKKIGNSFSVSKVLSISIRSQLSIIPSHYAYTPTIKQNFQNWLKNGFQNPYDGYFGGLFYSSSLKIIHSVFKESWKIKITPFEIFEIDKNPQSYFRKVFDIDNNINLSDCDFISKVNANSEQKNGKKMLINRKFNLLTQYAFKKNIKNKNSIDLTKKNSFSFLFYSLKLFISKSLYYFGRLIDKLVSYSNKKTYILLSDEEESLISNTYKKDNMGLIEFISEDDLYRFKYF